MSTFVSPEDVQSMEYFYEPFWQHKKPPVARQLHPSAAFEDQIRISNLALYLIDVFTLFDCWVLKYSFIGHSAIWELLVTSSGSSTASFEGSIGISNLASYLTYVFYSVMINGC